MQGQITNPILGPALQNLQTNITGQPAGFFQMFIPNLITLALIIGSLVAFFKLIIGAINWITAGGDKAGLEGAQKQITNALIGLAILLSTFAIFGLLENIFGIKLLSIDLNNIFIR